MITSHPAFWKSRAYTRRWRVVETAPEELTRYIQAVNDEAGRRTRVQPAVADEGFLQDLREALRELPTALLDRLEDRFLGVYLARDLGCSAIADVVLHEGAALGVAIVLDVTAIEGRGANTWATWEENEPFAADAPPLRVHVADAGLDHRKTALQLLLLHEFGHVLVAGRGFLPAWWLPPEALGPPADYPFLDLSWTLDAASAMVPRQPQAAALHRRVPFYAPTKLPGHEALACYTALQATDWPTLYAAANAYEDFSEALTLYVHTVVLRRPYRVEIDVAGRRVTVDDAARVAARCARKFAFVEALLAGPAPG